MGSLNLSLEAINTERASRWEIAMLRRKPTRIELRTEDKQEYEELKKLAAKGASSQSGANETVLDSLRKQAESRSARIGLTDD